MQIPHDYHMHTRFSEDGEDSPEAMCLKAIALGIPEIGFSEHWDVGPYEQNPRHFQPEPWLVEINRLRTLLAGQLIIRTGIEIAEPHLYPQQAAEALSRASFDFVIGSVHWVGPHFMFDAAYFLERTADEVYDSYFAELKRMVSEADIDIVAHLDIPVRTAKPLLGYDPSSYKDQIRAILRIVIDRGLTLDVNVAGLRKPSSNLMPDALILKWYAEMGGQRVTLGSDAHRANEVGLNLDSALEAVRAAGLTHVTQFERRQSRLVPIS